AGWAVDDDAAMHFARTFYKALTDGRNFLEAVGTARESTQRNFRQSNTWAAYQCYGDPDWRYRAASDGLTTPRAYSPPESVDALVLRLSHLKVRHEFDGLHDDKVREELGYLEQASPDDWKKLGAVSAGFGAVYGEIGLFADAIRWYQRALTSE